MHKRLDPPLWRWLYENMDAGTLAALVLLVIVILLH